MIYVLDSMRNGKVYGGKTTKFGITQGGNNYIVKLSKDNNMSVLSEYIASNFINSIGLNAHEVQLGIYADDLVNIMKDFTNATIKLHEYRDTDQSSEDTDLTTKSYSYNDITQLILKHTKIPTAYKKPMLTHFWLQFICDAILGNRDRHAGNWGYLHNLSTGEYRPAPIYDNGATLFPDINRHINEVFDYTFFKDRTLTFPASIIQQYSKEEKRNKRTNYKQIFSNLSRYSDLGIALLEFNANVDYTKIVNSITLILKDLSIDVKYKVFYKTIICLRYLVLIKGLDFDTAYEIVMR